MAILQTVACRTCSYTSNITNCRCYYIILLFSQLPVEAHRVLPPFSILSLDCSLRQIAVKIVGLTLILLIVICDLVFWISGTSLLSAISISLTNSRRSSIDASAWTASVTASVRALTGPDGDSLCLGNLANTASRGSGRRGLAGGRGKRGPAREGVREDAAERGRRHLSAAKRKVKWAMLICAQFSLQAYAILIFSIFTKYGTATPCVLFGIQMTILPLIWHVGNIQLHAGRSRLAGRGGLLTGRTTGGHGGVAQSRETARQQEQRRKKPSGNISAKLLSMYRAAFVGQTQPVAPVERDEEAAAVASAGTDGDVGTNAITPC